MSIFLLLKIMKKLINPAFLDVYSACIFPVINNTDEKPSDKSFCFHL